MSILDNEQKLIREIKARLAVLILIDSKSLVKEKYQQDLNVDLIYITRLLDLCKDLDTIRLSEISQSSLNNVILHFVNQIYEKTTALKNAANTDNMTVENLRYICTDLYNLYDGFATPISQLIMQQRVKYSQLDEVQKKLMLKTPILNKL